MTQNIYDNDEFFRAYSRMERSVTGLDGAEICVGVGDRMVARQLGGAPASSRNIDSQHPRGILPRPCRFC